MGLLTNTIPARHVKQKRKAIEAKDSSALISQMASLDVMENSQLLYHVYKSIPQKMQMLFPVSLLQWKIELCGGNLSQRSSN